MNNQYLVITDAAKCLVLVEKTNSSEVREATIRKMERFLLSAIEMGHNDRTIQTLVEMLRTAHQYRF